MTKKELETMKMHLSQNALKLKQPKRVSNALTKSPKKKKAVFQTLTVAVVLNQTAFSKKEF